MPCDQLRTTNIQWGQNTNMTLLAEALKAMGYQVNQTEAQVYATRYGTSVTYNAGTSQIAVRATRGQQLDEAQLKREYSHQVVQSTAKRFGWALQKTTANQYIAQRRF